MGNCSFGLLSLLTLITNVLAFHRYLQLGQFTLIRVSFALLTANLYGFDGSSLAKGTGVFPVQPFPDAGLVEGVIAVQLCVRILI